MFGGEEDSGGTVVYESEAGRDGVEDGGDGEESEAEFPQFVMREDRRQEEEETGEDTEGSQAEDDVVENLLKLLRVDDTVGTGGQQPGGDELHQEVGQHQVDREVGQGEQRQ